MRETMAAPSPEQFLRAEYPDDRHRERVIRQLGWLACRMEASGLALWKIPDRVPARQIRMARRLMICAILALDATLVIAITSRDTLILAAAVLFVVGVAVIITKWIGSRKMPAAVRRRPPCVIVPRWPGWGQLAALLLATVTSLGLGFFCYLLLMWSVPAEERPAVDSYRADRLSSLLYGLACAPVGALFGALVFVQAWGSPSWLADTLLSALAVSAIVWAVRGSSYSLLKLTELSLTIKWRERVNFLDVLEDAEHHELLDRTAGVYVFRDSAMLAHLKAKGLAADEARGQERTPRTAARSRPFKAALRAGFARLAHWVLRPQPAARSRLLAVVSDRLTRPRTDRIAVDFSLGTAIAVLAGYLLSAIPSGTGVAIIVVLSFLYPLMSFLIATVVAKVLLQAAAVVARRGAVVVPRVSRKVRVGSAVVVIAVAGILVAEAGSFLAKALAYALPPAFVAACGLWLCVLAFRKLRSSPRKWLRRVPDQVAVAASAAALLIAVHRELLTAQWATVLLFPVAFAGSLRLWSVMKKARRLFIRAGADITLSLLLGGELVLFLVWLANVLAMPRSEISLIRTELSSAGSFAAVYNGGRLWAGIYAVLAAASAILALHPGPLKRVTEWFDRLRLAGVASAAQRVLTGIYIGLLTIVFVGVAGPSALTPTLQHQLKTTYEVALQRQLAMEAEESADNEIRAAISALRTPAAVSILGYLIQDIHHDAHQRAGAPEATKAEDVLAHRLGQEQAIALNLPAPPSPQAAGPTGPGSGDFDQPVRDAQEMSNLASEATARENSRDQARDHLKAAFELTVTALTNAVPVPGISKNEVAQIVTQYLSGLVGDSSVMKSMEAWLEQHGKMPRRADELVIPNPDRLDNVAQSDLNREAAAQGVIVLPDLKNAFPSITASTAELDQAAVSDAVSSASQAQEIQQTGGCPGCIDNGTDDGSHKNDNHDDEPGTHVEVP